MTASPPEDPASTADQHHPAPAQPSHDSPTSLQGAQKLVKRAIRQLADQGSLAPERAEELLAQVPRHATRFALSQWVFATDPITDMFCQYPECFRGRRPYQGRGQPPKHCDLRDPRDPDKWAHTSTTSRQRRDQLLDQAAGITRTAKGADEDDERRPVSHARESIPTMVSTLVEETQTLNSRVVELTRHVRTVGDLEARDVEIESIRLDAKREVDEEKGRALELAQRVRTMSAELDELTARIHEARDAAAESDRDRDEAVQARDREIGARERESAAAAAKVANAEATAKWLIAEVLFDAEQKLAAALAQFEADREAMRAEVDAANQAVTDALTQAERRERDADTMVARANQKATDADTERNEAKAEIRAAKAEIAGLRTKVQEREDRHEAVVADLDRRHRSEVEALRETGRELQDRIDQLRDEREERDAQARTERDQALAAQDRAHQGQIRDLRQSYERSLADRDTLHATASTQAQETISALRSVIAQLEQRLDAQAAERDAPAPVEEERTQP